MPRLLGRAASRKDDVLDDGCGKRVALVVDRSLRLSRWGRAGSGGGRTSLGTPTVETCQNIGDPGRRRLVIIHVAINPGLQPPRSKLLKAAVQAFTGFAV